MAKDIYKITNFQSGVNTSGDSRDIQDSYSTEITGLSSSNAGKLKVHGGLDYYSVSKGYVTVNGQSIITPEQSIFTAQGCTLIEYDGNNDLGGSGLFYFIDDYDLSELNPDNWSTVSSSYTQNGVEYFILHHNGFLSLINIKHNSDGTQNAHTFVWNGTSNNIIYDGIKGRYYHRLQTGGGATVDNVDY